VPWRITKAVRDTKCTGTWDRFVTTFLTTFGGSLAFIYSFILLVDPYAIVPFSLPFERRIVSVSQAFVYPQIVLSKKYDSLMVGTSTSRLLDPDYLSTRFNVRLANLAMNSMQAWEQKTMVEYFRRHVGPPKMLIVAIDGMWCSTDADRVRHNQAGWPDWMYDDNRWNDYLYLLNERTLEIAVRLVGYKLGLYPERVRFDGFEVFTPPEDSYNPVRARENLWGGANPRSPVDLPPPVLSSTDKSSLDFPALKWLDDITSSLPHTTSKVFAFMPVHITGQPWPGTRGAAVEAECKAQIIQIAQKVGAKVIDWRIPSPITREDSNYWDSAHYRLPIAQRIQRELAEAVLNDRESLDGSYRILVR
jgi:hypothetical protein